MNPSKQNKTEIMRSIYISIAFTLCALAESKNILKGFKVHALNASSFQRSLGEKNVCAEDMDIIANNEDLNTVMLALNDRFDRSFDANFTDYCVGQKVGDVSEMSCLVDYSRFSEDYENKCWGLGGELYNIALFMSCQGEIPGGTFDLEMELSNVPSCVGFTCDLGEIYTALLDVIRATEASVSGADNGLTCNFYHDYESLQSAPNTITIQDGRSEPNNEVTSGSLYRNVYLSMIISTGIALFLFQ